MADFSPRFCYSGIAGSVDIGAQPSLLCNGWREAKVGLVKERKFRLEFEVLKSFPVKSKLRGQVAKQVTGNNVMECMKLSK